VTLQTQNKELGFTGSTHFDFNSTNFRGKW
jgi:hypothetical protein